MSVHRKLMEARVKLQNTKLEKTGSNKFAGYSYFELGDFLPAAQQIFNELGLCGVVSYATDIATLTITDVDGGGQITITSPMAEANLKGCHPIQNLGAVETYTRRYLWVAALEIVEHDAIDATTKKETPNSVPAQIWDKFSEADRRKFQGIADEVRAAMVANDMESALIMLSEITDPDEKSAIWSRFDSKERSLIKAASKKE